jgi:hypothetical protein
VGPALLGYLRIIALGNRPGARRVHDAGTLAGDEPAVVAGVVPSVDFGRIERHEFLEIFERGARLAGIDLDVVLLVHHD